MMITTTTASDRNNPDALTNALTRRQAVVGAAIAFGSLALGSPKAWAASAATEAGISYTAAAIHQEPVFKASPKRVYEALTDAKQFDKVIQISGVMQAMHLADKPAEISRDVGGAFALFGGYITGRQLELVPDQRIVQAWRAGSWPSGIFSIARFELVEQGSGGNLGTTTTTTTTTKIVFDHTGFPNGEAESLASGWKAHYWEPLEKLLA
jgi:uncharacterized protein YndB with AHSA1/START domain